MVAPLFGADVEPPGESCWHQQACGHTWAQAVAARSAAQGNAEPFPSPKLAAKQPARPRSVGGSGGLAVGLPPPATHTHRPAPLGLWPAAMTSSDYGDAPDCPLCCTELDLTDRSIQYCSCGCEYHCVCWVLLPALRLARRGPPGA